MGRNKKNNYWAIRGVETIFESWDTCLKYKKGSSGVAKGFKAKEDAIAYSKGEWNKVEGSTNIWTDGATPDNGCEDACGGYAVVYGKNDKRNQSFEVTPAIAKGQVTNNICETMAVIAALESLKKNGIEGDVVIHSDSEYVLGFLNSSDKSGYKKNKELLDKLHNLRGTIQNNIQFKYVNGHGGNAGNELADVLATEAAKNCKKRKIATDDTETAKKIIKQEHLLEDD